MPTRREFLIGGVLLSAFIVPTIIEATHTGPNGDVLPSHVGSHYPNTLEWAVLNEINAYRQANGIRRLEMSRSLAAAARHHAVYMSLNDDIDHTLGTIDWSRNIWDYGYPISAFIGENAAAGRQSAAGTVAQWKASPPHNANMLNPNFIRIGVGRVYYGEGYYRYYWVTTFGDVSSRTIYQ